MLPYFLSYLLDSTNRGTHSLLRLRLKIYTSKSQLDSRSVGFLRRISSDPVLGGLHCTEPDRADLSHA